MIVFHHYYYTLQWWWLCYFVYMVILLPRNSYGAIVCVDHQRPSILNSRQSIARYCNEASSNVRKASQHIPYKLYYKLHCADTESVCDRVNNTVNAATEIISSILQLESPLYVNISYYSFCDLFNECIVNKSETSIGQAYPSVSYLMTDESDNTTRMYPQATLKQFPQLKPKPQWLQYDIVAQFNSDNNWYFMSDPSPIFPKQNDFLRTVIHELVHGLGFVSSWSDSLYQRFAPYVDHLPPFLTPMLLTPPKQLQSIAQNEKTDHGHQPFWGFVECPLDKYLVYHTVRMSTLTHLLNKWGNANVLYNTIYDMVNAWVNADLSLYAQSAYLGSTTPRDIVLSLPNRQQPIVMETTLLPFSDGSTLSHVDYATYCNSSDYLMTYTSNPGISIAALNDQFPGGPLGPELLHVLAALGYRIRSPPPSSQLSSSLSSSTSRSSQDSHTTTRPPIKFWNPPSNLVGTTDNPAANASVVTNGPARTPLSSVAPSPSSSGSSTPLQTSLNVVLVTFLSMILFV